MPIDIDLLQLEPGRYIELFQLEVPGEGLEGMLYFHQHLQVEQIYFDDIAYSPWPIKATGFELTTDQPPSPKLSVGNVNSSITALCLFYEDLVGAKLTRIRTFAKYLDPINFEGGNASADPAQRMPLDIWLIERKSYEDDQRVDFELASALDFNGVALPRRDIVNRCGWLASSGYRGPDCGYSGPPVAMKDDTPTSDPALDRCGGMVSSCKLRFGENGELSHGGFPAAGLMRS